MFPVGSAFWQGAPAASSLITFFGENLTPFAAVVGNPVTARTAFLDALSGTVANYGFEDRINGDRAPFSFTFANTSGSITATLTDPGSGSVVNGATSGRFNTTAAGTNYWKCNETAAGGNVLVLTFSPPISAFGFYGTDVGDFGGSLTLTVRNSSTLVSTPLSVGNAIGSSGSTSGCLLFYGFIDKTATYDRIVFTGNGSTSDFFGFDDLIAAVAAQVR